MTMERNHEFEGSRRAGGGLIVVAMDTESGLRQTLLAEQSPPATGPDDRPIR